MTKTTLIAACLMLTLATASVYATTCPDRSAGGRLPPGFRVYSQFGGDPVLPSSFGGASWSSSPATNSSVICTYVNNNSGGLFTLYNNTPSKPDISDPKNMWTPPMNPHVCNTHNIYLCPFNP